MEHYQKMVPFVSIIFETVNLELSLKAPVSVYRLAVQEPWLFNVTNPESNSS